jgi:hypothetical protein
VLAIELGERRPGARRVLQPVMRPGEGEPRTPLAQHARVLERRRLPRPVAVGDVEAVVVAVPRHPHRRGRMVPAEGAGPSQFSPKLRDEEPHGLPT